MIKTCRSLTELAGDGVFAAVELHLAVGQRRNFASDDNASAGYIRSNSLIDPGIDDKVRIRIESNELHSCRATV